MLAKARGSFVPIEPPQDKKINMLLFGYEDMSIAPIVMAIPGWLEQLAADQNTWGNSLTDVNQQSSTDASGGGLGCTC